MIEDPLLSHERLNAALDYIMKMRILSAEWNTIQAAILHLLQPTQQNTMTDERRKKVILDLETVNYELGHSDALGLPARESKLKLREELRASCLQSGPAVKEGFEDLESAVQHFSDLVDAYKDSERQHLELIEESRNHLLNAATLMERIGSGQRNNEGLDKWAKNFYGCIERLNAAISAAPAFQAEGE